MASGPSGFPPPLTCGGDPAAPPQESGVLRTGNVAQDLEAMSPTSAVNFLVAGGGALPTPPASGALPIRPEENSATDKSALPDEMGR